MLWYQGSHLQRTTTITTILHRSFCLQLKSHQKKHVGNIQKTPHLKKKLGQHLLINEKILTQIVQAANLSEMFTKKNKKKLKILEIGPGTGNLTSALLNFDGGIDTNKVHVHAIEYDERMVLGLEERFSNEIASNRLMIEQKDFESFSFFDSQHIEIPFDACIANIPYQLSSLIVARLSQYMHSFPHVFQCAVLLVQDEFALRLLAK
jgi:18S rRNA (adenine1779-N6/adenine1780-N6)-dimethyltransferase